MRRRSEAGQGRLAARRRRLRRVGGRVQTTEGDVREPFRDITLHTGGHRAVADRCLGSGDHVPHKRARNADFPNADAYQMLACCTRLGLGRGFLVYADLDGASPGTSAIRNSAVEIRRRSDAWLPVSLSSPTPVGPSHCW